MDSTCSKITAEDYDNVTISVFRTPTRDRLSCMLNAKKVLPSPEKIPRDWRGLGTLLNHTIPLGCDPIDPVGKILNFCEVKSTITDFIRCLERIDRYDVIEETKEFISYDIISFKQRQYSLANPETAIRHNDFDNTIITLDDEFASFYGLSLPKYDAFLLYDYADTQIAETVVDKLEIEYKLKLCLKERDLRPGILFEYQSIVRLIFDRCKWLIVIVSNNFLNSPWNTFIMNYTRSLAIEQQLPKIIPCVFSDCTLPQELKWFAYIYFNKTNKFYDPWTKLKMTVSSNNKMLTNFAENNNNNYQKLKLKEIADE